VFEFLDGFNDEALKKASSTKAKGDTFFSLMKSLTQLTRQVTNEYNFVQLLLKMILRLLTIASFSGKMKALNETSKVIPSYKDKSQLTPEKIATWIKESKVLEVVLRDNLYQPQYVQNLEKLLRFCIKEEVLTIEDLDTIWASQDGKHGVIVKNIYDILAKLAWDFSPEQWDHLLNNFQRSWVHAGSKQRDELFKLITCLAEDSKDKVIVNKVLDMLWTLAKREDCPPDSRDHALNAHIKILDMSCAQDCYNRKMKWLVSCTDELNLGSKWVIPALNHFKDVCCLYPVPPPKVHYQRVTYIYYRTQVIQHIDMKQHIISKVIESLQDYMDLIRTAKENDDSVQPETYFVDDRYCHFVQVQNRVDFIRFLIQDGSLWLAISHVLNVWKTLAEFPVFPSDREVCLKWFSKLVSDEPDLEPDTIKHMFIENIMKLSPNLLTDNGFRCFDQCFRHVNFNDKKLKQWRGPLVTDRLDLMGLDYLWDVILTGQQGIANIAIELMTEIYTNLTPQLKERNVPQEFLKSCFDQMKEI
jgi:ubiquitin carboxyl-terminal hydrolase 9/24